MTAPPEASSSPRPRVVLIVSNGPLCIGDPEMFGGQPCSHAAIKMPLLPLPALAMTAATGVNPLVHSIVTAPMLDPDDLQPRPPRSSDRRFPAFWTDAAAAGLRTLAIDWPATDDDPDLPDAVSPRSINEAIKAAAISTHADLARLLEPDAAADRQQRTTAYLLRLDITLAAAEEAASAATPPDAMAIVLREAPPSIPPDRVAAYVQDRLCSLLSAVPVGTTVIMVRRWISGDETARVYPSAMTLLGGAQKTSTATTDVSLLSIGGAARILCGLPCPHGVVPPQWPFLAAQPPHDHRPFPIGATSSNSDLAAMVQRVLEMPAGDARTRAITVLSKEVSVLTTIAVASQRFEELAMLAAAMVGLRGNAVDYWSSVEALHHTGDLDARDQAIQALATAHPGHSATTLALALTHIQDAPAEVKQQLADIDIADFQIKSALGMLGRICFRADLPQQGEAAISRAISLRVASSMDRVALSAHLLRTDRAEEAFELMGRIGIPPNNHKWCILRLRILLKLGQTDVARRLADAILAESPADNEVASLMRGISNSG